MIVNQFSSFPYGGAGGAARGLHDGLLDQQIDSRFYYWKNPQQKRPQPSLHEMHFLPQWDHPLLRHVIRKYRKIRLRKIRQQYDDHLSERAGNFEVFSTPRLPNDTSFDLENLGGHILHLHWVSFFLDYPSFFSSIPDKFPIVWTLHDMNPISGGCHYSTGCTRYKMGCGECPQIRNPGPKDVSHDGYRIKQRSLKRKNLTVITPSRWLQDVATQSKIFPANTRFEFIRYGFDLKKYRPIEKSEARRRLGIDTDSVLLAFGAEDINNYRKGFHHLLDALPSVAARTNIECLVFGSGEIPKTIEGLPKIHQFGFVDSPERQSEIYSAADIFALPSREDNSPQTGLEAMACGTPVVAFQAGGIPEYVTDGKTGLLAPTGDSIAMGASIVWLAENKIAREQMGIHSRKVMENQFERRTQTSKHIDLYNELVEHQPVQKARRAA